MDDATLTERQRIEKNCFNAIVHDKWDNKSLLVKQTEPPFAYYSGDLFDGALYYLGDLDESIAIAKQRSVENETADKTHFSVSPGESTPFQDNFFDIIFISVSLHHFSGCVLPKRGRQRKKTRINE